MTVKLINKNRKSTVSVGDENCRIKEPRLIVRFALIDTIVAAVLLLLISGALFLVRNQRVDNGTVGVPTNSDIPAQVIPRPRPDLPPLDDEQLQVAHINAEFIIERVNGVIVSQTTPIRVEVGDLIQYALYFQPAGTYLDAPVEIVQTYNANYLRYVGMYEGTTLPTAPIVQGRLVWSNATRGEDVPAFSARVIKPIFRANHAGLVPNTNIVAEIFNTTNAVDYYTHREYKNLRIDNPPPLPALSVSSSKFLTPKTAQVDDLVRIQVAILNAATATRIMAPVTVTVNYKPAYLKYLQTESMPAGSSGVQANTTTGTLTWTDVSGAKGMAVGTGTYFGIQFDALKEGSRPDTDLKISVTAKDIYGQTARANYVVSGLILKPLPKPEPKPTPTPEPTALERIQDFFNLTPQQENVVKTVIAPSTAIINAINLAAAANPINIGYLFLLLFTEPFQFILRRKRGNTSVIYNALSKHPLALVMVRLVEAKTGRIVKTAVTDPKGRFALSGPPGQYRIQVKKSGFTFPSETVSGVRDSGFANIYHGDVFELTEDNPMVVASIPLDPPKTEKTRQAVRRSNFYRIFQNVIAWVGIVIAVILVILAPSALTISLLIAHVLFFFLFRYFARLQAPPTWGQVYDFLTGRPVRGAVVRIYDAQYERLLDSKVTNIRGRYGFLVGQNEYLLDAAKSGYDFPAPEKKKPDDYLGGKFTPRKGSIKMNIPLHRAKRK